MLKSLLPKNVKVNIAIDDIKLKSNLPTNKNIRFTEESIFYVVLGFTRSNSGVLDDIPGFVQIIPGSYKSSRAISKTGFDKSHLKCDCVDGSVVNDV